MVNAVIGSIFLMNRDNRLGYEVDRHYVDSVVGTKREHREAREKYERTHHVELCGFRLAAVA